MKKAESKKQTAKPPTAAEVWEKVRAGRATLTHSQMLAGLAAAGITEGQTDGMLESIERLPFIEVSDDLDFTDTRFEQPFQMMRRAQLFPSALNPRKTFSAEALRELAVSMRSGTGVIQPLTVRLADEGSETLEIVCGERRWRASGAVQVDGETLPEMEFLPVKIVTMTDEEALRAMLAENMQREDLSAIEEARAFSTALEGGGTQMALAESLGIPPARISSRLKLLRLSEQGVELVEAGQITLEVAESIASAPGSMIAKLCNFVSSPKKYPLERFPRQFDDPFTVEDVENLVRSMSARLHEAPFDLDDATLVPVHLANDGTRLDGGACEGCPFNTQTNATQKTGKGIRADVPYCTNRNCYDEKVERFTASALVAAKDAGAVVASADEAARIFAEGGNRVNPDYVELAAKLTDAEKAPNTTGSPTWGDIVSGRDGRPAVPVVAASDSKGNVRKFARRELAELAAQKMGNGSFLAGQSADPSLDKRERAEQEAARDEQARTARKERRDKIFAFSEKFSEIMPTKVHIYEDWAIGLAIRHATPSGVEFICKRRGIDTEDDAAAAVLSHAHGLIPQDREGLFFELLLSLDFADAIRDEKKPLIAEAIRPALEYFGVMKNGKI